MLYHNQQHEFSYYIKTDKEFIKLYQAMIFMLPVLIFSAYFRLYLRGR